MLGEAISMLVPQVVGFRLHGALPEGATATDLVLTVTQILRQTGVVGRFVEYFGHGLVGLPLADRATIGNMSPEYGATCGFFPVDAETLRYLRLTGRSDDKVGLVEAYCRENGLWHDPDDRPTPRSWSSISPRWSRGSPGRDAPRTGFRFARRATPSRLRCRRSGWEKEGTAVSTRRSRSRWMPVTRRFDADPRAADRGRPDDRRRLGGDRPRRRRDRRDHVLHEHLQPGRDDRRRTAREEGGRAWPHPQAVGEDKSRTRLQGRDRVLRKGSF